MREFTSRPETQSFIVAPEVLFLDSRLEDTLDFDNDKHRNAINTVAVLLEGFVKPQPSEGLEARMHRPSHGFLPGEKEKGFLVTSYKYDTEEAYENTTLRSNNGNTLLATVENYRPELLHINTPVTETFCVTRDCRAYVRREEKQPDGSVWIATKPAGWEDLSLISSKAAGISPIPVRGEQSAATRELVDVARNNIQRSKAILNDTPEFRQAVMDYFAAAPGHEAQVKPEEHYVGLFWSGEQPYQSYTDSPSSMSGMRKPSLTFAMGAHVITVSHYKDLVASRDFDLPTATERNGVTVDETLKISIDNMPGQVARREMAFTTKPDYAYGNVKYTEFEDFNGDVALRMSIDTSDAPISEVQVPVDETMALLPVRSDISESLHAILDSPQDAERTKAAGELFRPHTFANGGARDMGLRRQVVPYSQTRFRHIVYPGADVPYQETGVIGEEQKMIPKNPLPFEALLKQQEGNQETDRRWRTRLVKAAASLGQLLSRKWQG